MPRPKRHAWYQALRAHTALIDLMEAELQADCGVPLVWYDVLVEIAKRDAAGVRMSDLADQVLLSRSWLTRRVIQLEQAGLVERLAAEGDGRGVAVRLTATGRTTFAAMERSHARSIQEHFSRHLLPGEADVIAEAFGRIADDARAALGRSA